MEGEGGAVFALWRENPDALGGQPADRAVDQALATAPAAGQVPTRDMHGVDGIIPADLALAQENGGG